MRREDTRSWFSHLLYKLGCAFSRLQLPPSLPSPRHGTCPAKRAVSLVPWPGHVLLVDPRGVTLQPGLRCSDHLVQALQREDWLHWVVSPPYPRKMSQNLAEPTQKRVIKIKKYFWPPPRKTKIQPPCHRAGTQQPHHHQWDGWLVAQDLPFLQHRKGLSFSTGAQAGGSSSSKLSHKHFLSCTAS